MKSKTSLFIFLLLLAAVGLKAQSSSHNKEKEKRQLIEENNRMYFIDIANSDMNAFALQYAADCWIMLPGLPIHCGPDAPVDFFKAILQKKNIASGKFITVDLYGISEEIMAEVGFYQFYDKSGAQFDDGKYITLWKNINGEWKRFRESLSSSRQ